jgi:hypothetical protein
LSAVPRHFALFTNLQNLRLQGHTSIVPDWIRVRQHGCRNLPGQADRSHPQCLSLRARISESPPVFRSLRGKCAVPLFITVSFASRDTRTGYRRLADLCRYGKHASGHRVLLYARIRWGIASQPICPGAIQPADVLIMFPECTDRVLLRLARSPVETPPAYQVVMLVALTSRPCPRQP